MINTLLEHVPIKMEVQDVDETNGIPHSPPQDERVAKDDENIDETDEEEDAEGIEVDDDDDGIDEEDIDEEDEEDDEEESDIENDALEIEKEATMLISSDEEAELEAQRIRFPAIAITKKLRRDSNISSCSSNRSSQTSNFSSQPHITYEIVKQKICTKEETNNKQRISPHLKLVENKSFESYNKENNNKNTTLLKQKTENKNSENNKSLESSKTKPEETHRHLDCQKATEIYKNSENNRKRDHLLKSPEQKSRRGSNNSTCSVASTVTSDSTDTESCGNIYVFNLEQKLIFNCEFCDLKYGDLDNFGLHLHEAHKLFNFDEDPEKENAPRNLGKSNRQSISAPKNSVNVKKEPLQYADLKAEPPVALPPAALAEPLDSCGNVFMLNHRKLFLVCGYCESKYANLELFEKHLRQQHRIFEGCQNEVNVVPKVEVKDEEFFSCENANTPDIIPQAMVAIPAEIPLDISITPENEHETIAALADVAVEQEQVAVQKDTVQQNATVLEKLTDLKETSVLENPADEKIAIICEKPAEHCAAVAKEQLTLASKTEELSITTRTEITDVASDNALTAENEMLKNEDKVKPVTRRTRSKRQSTPDKQLESPNKRPKRKTRNNVAIEEEPTALNATDSHSTKILQAEEQTCIELLKIEETQDNCKLRKSPVTAKCTTTAEVEKQTNICKSAKSLETEIKTPTRVFNEMPEFEQKITFEATDTNETERAKDVEKIPLKMSEVAESSKITELEPETNTSGKFSKTRESRKTIDLEKARPETKKSRKFADSDKTTDAKLVEAEKATPLTPTEIRETRKKYERKLIDPAEVKLPAAREPRQTRVPDKKTSLQKTDVRETRTTPKRAAKDNPVLETIEHKKQSLPKTASANEIKKSAVANESKNNRVEQTSETESSKFKCSVCFKKFTKKKSLIWHERTHQADSNKRHGCGICGKYFLVESERKAHMLTRHNADALSECSMCYRAFSSKSDLGRHIERTHAARLFKCGECLRTYSTESSLKTHMYVYHSASKKGAARTKKNSAQKRNLSLTKQLKEQCSSDDSIEKAAPQTEDCVNNDINTTKKVKELIAESPIESSAMIFALDDINAKPIDISEQLPNEGLVHLRESTNTYVVTPPSNATEQTIFVADLPVQTNNHELVLEQQTDNAALKDLLIDSEDKTKSLQPTTAAFGEGDEEDDPAADPVNDIIEQLQNELAENSLESTATTTNNVVTYTINALPNIEEAQTSVVLDAQLNVVDKTEDVKPTFLKIVKHFVCDICSKTYYKHSRLIEHKRLHTGEKPFGCDECGKQFRVRNRLNEHKQRHSKEKKFKCEICQLPLCTRQDYNLHMRHHTNDRRHQCSVCPKAFVRSSDLKIHERIHTGEKPYVCDICNKSFRANQNLSVHKKSHMGDISKTFKCEYCEKKFMRKIDRKVHMRTHTGEKPYKCEICQRGYSSRVNVRAHIDRDHIKGSQEEKKKPGPKPRSLREELERQKKLIEELQNQLLQQIKTDDKLTLSDEEIQEMHILPDPPMKVSSPATTPAPTTKNDPVQSAYKLLSKLKSASSVSSTTLTTTSKSLTVIPSPTPSDEPPCPPNSANTKTDSTTTLLPLTITQKLEQASPTTSSASAATSCVTTPSSPPPALPAATKTTATKVVSQKTSLGIQQVSVTVSMQVENVTANTSIAEKENSQILTTPSSGATSVKKERKITSYFTVLDQKSKV